MRDDLPVLVIDRAEAMHRAVMVALAPHGIRTLHARTPTHALEAVRGHRIGVVLQDMAADPTAEWPAEVTALFHAVHAAVPDVPVVLMTSGALSETAATLVREGAAADYVARPWNEEKLVATLRNLLALRRARLENDWLREQQHTERRALEARFDLRGVVYASAVMQRRLTLATSVAPSDAPVLITGPNGAGKEVLADVVVANSRRHAQPYVKVNAGGFPDELLEAELFGAEPGAFTGATQRRVGRFEAAHGGTLFLDEIANLTPRGQARLLRVLQTGEFERLGSSRTIRADVRIVSATNADLRAEIAAGRFREDLYFRLNVIEIRVPALADRREDIVPLAESFLARFAPPNTPLRLSPAALHVLHAHAWPGNVRELSNRVRRAAIVCRNGVVDPADLDLGPSRGSDYPAPSSAALAWQPPALGLAAPDAVAAPAPKTAPDEREALARLLERCNGVVAYAAAELGVSRQALYRRMRRLGLEIERRLR